MQVLEFLNKRNIGKAKNSLENKYWKPNLDHLLSRLACREDDVYFSYGEGGYVPTFACKFRKDNYKDLLAVANEEGEIMLIDTDGDKGLVKAFTAHNNAIFDICWLPDKNHLITASGDHKACLWDMNTCQVISSFKNHSQSVKAVDVCHNDNALFATASKDGTICLWDTRDKCQECGNCRDKPSISIRSAHYRKLTSQSKSKKPIHNSTISGVSSLAFQDNINLASGGNSDGIVKIWDLRKTYITKPSYVPSPRHQMKYAGNSSVYGCTTLVFDSIYKKLYGCSTEHKIFMFDCHSYSDAMALSYEGFKCKTFFVKMALSADDQYLLCGSSDCKGYIWKTSKPGLPIVELPGHKCEVTAVAWDSFDSTKLVTCGDDYKICVWKTINNLSPEIPDDIIATSHVINTDKKLSSNSKSDSSVPDSFQTPVIISNTSSIESTYSSEVIPVQTQTSISSSQTVRTPTMKSITSFFQPVSTPVSFTNYNVISPGSTSSGSRVSPSQILSPSKLSSQNIILKTSSLNPGSPKKRNLFSKENYSAANSSSQTKRKSSSSMKHQKKAKQLKRNSGAKNPSKESPESTITNYFQLSTSSDD